MLRPPIKQTPMPITSAIASILVALLLGAISSGLSFVLVARNAIGLSRGNGVTTAVGMGIGRIFFAGGRFVAFMRCSLRCDGMGWDGMGWDGMGWDGTLGVRLMVTAKTVGIYADQIGTNLRHVG